MRLRRARELAGLSRGQAIRLIRIPGLAKDLLCRFEDGRIDPSAHCTERMCEVYDVNLLWLRGYEIPLVEKHLAIIRQIENTSDRARVAELLASLPVRPTPRSPDGIYDDEFPDLKDGQFTFSHQCPRTSGGARSIIKSGHHFSVTPSGSTGFNTGRQRYRVVCLTCDHVVVHEAASRSRKV